MHVFSRFAGGGSLGELLPEASVSEGVVSRLPTASCCHFTAGDTKSPA